MIFDRWLWHNSKNNVNEDSYLRVHSTKKEIFYIFYKLLNHMLEAKHKIQNSLSFSSLSNSVCKRKSKYSNLHFEQ